MADYIPVICLMPNLFVKKLHIVTNNQVVGGLFGPLTNIRKTLFNEVGFILTFEL